MAITYQPAQQAESPATKTLLKKCDLPADDIDLHLPNFFTAKSDDGRIIGVVGLEVYGRAGLLRSMAVEPDFRKQGIARALNERIFTKARLLGLHELYLLTITAVEYSSRLGFSRIERDSVPQSILNTAEFRTLCPKTAVCFYKRMDNLHNTLKEQK
jgi:amino-acid N-acetyltransferase